VECAEIPMKQQRLNVDSVFFPRSMYGACDQVRVLRVYYELAGSTLEERLHCKDFVPKRVNSSQLTTTSGSGTVFESFDGLWKQVKGHFACNRKRQFLNAQTLCVEAPGKISHRFKC
jgi:hypothetical protein